MGQARPVAAILEAAAALVDCSFLTFQLQARRLRMLLGPEDLQQQQLAALAAREARHPSVLSGPFTRKLAVVVVVEDLNLAMRRLVPMGFMAVLAAAAALVVELVDMGERHAPTFRCGPHWMAALDRTQHLVLRDIGEVPVWALEAARPPRQLMEAAAREEGMSRILAEVLELTRPLLLEVHWRHCRYGG